MKTKYLWIFLFAILIISLSYIPKTKAVDYTTIYDDEGAIFWLDISYGSGSYKLTKSDSLIIKYSGDKSVNLNITNDGSYAYIAIQHTFSAIDFSLYDAISFMWYGTTCDKWVYFYIMVDGANFYQWMFKENWNGWQLVTFVFDTFGLISGSPSLSSASIIRFTFLEPTIRNVYLDLGRVFLIDYTPTDSMQNIIFGGGAWLFWLVIACLFVFITYMVKYFVVIGIPFFFLLGMQYYNLYKTGTSDLLWFWLLSWILIPVLAFMAVKVHR